MGAGAKALRLPTASVQEAQMNALSIRTIRLVLPTAFAFAVLLAPIPVRAGDGATDCHEIPKFVLERTEIVAGVE
jgi:hypothetical protein